MQQSITTDQNETKAHQMLPRQIKNSGIMQNAAHDALSSLRLCHLEQQLQNNRNNIEQVTSQLHLKGRKMVRGMG